MLMLTEGAAELIKSLAEAPGAEGVRISTTPAADGAAPGFEVAVAPGPDADDAVLEGGGARIFLTPGAADALDDKVLHAEADEGQVQFRVLEQS